MGNHSHAQYIPHVQYIPYALATNAPLTENLPAEGLAAVMICRCSGPHRDCQQPTVSLRRRELHDVYVNCASSYYHANVAARSLNFSGVSFGSTVYLDASK
jgi:hypothetical protein